MWVQEQDRGGRSGKSQKKKKKKKKKKKNHSGNYQAHFTRISLQATYYPPSRPNNPGLLLLFRQICKLSGCRFRTQKKWYLFFLLKTWLYKGMSFAVQIFFFGFVLEMLFFLFWYIFCEVEGFIVTSIKKFKNTWLHFLASCTFLRWAAGCHQCRQFSLQTTFQKRCLHIVQYFPKKK